jgi:CubicO group peptidase (beta-lactamase class C family)
MHSTSLRQCSALIREMPAERASFGMPRQPRTPALAKLVCLLSLASACAGRATGAASAASPAEARLDARASALLAEQQVASMGVAVIEDGRVTMAKVYGRRGPGVPATDATLFNLASLTKPVTAELMLRLASAGKLSLDEPMARYWVDPDIAADPRRERLTPRMALDHQTGFPNWRDENHAGGRLSFLFDPGTAFGYSGEGYNYLGRFAERRVGRSFESLAEEYVFAPIGMKSTSYSSRGWMRDRLAIPLDSAGRWTGPQVSDSGKWNGANNLITTIGDYARFVVSVMKGEGLSSAMSAQRRLPSAGPHPPVGCKPEPKTLCPRALTFALGWVRLDYQSGPIMVFVGRNERPGGERTFVSFDPARRRGVVVLTSGQNGQRLIFEVLDVVDPGSPVTAFLRQRG